MNKLIITILICLYFLIGCRVDKDPPIIDGGPTGFYYIENKTSIQLYVISSLDFHRNWDTILLPQDTVVNFQNEASFNTTANPSNNLYNVELMTKDSIGYRIVYEQIPIVDSLWQIINFDSSINSFPQHFKLQVVDSMLQ